MEFLLSAQYFLTRVAKVWCLAIFCSRSHSAWWSWTSASSAASTSSFSLPSHVVGKNTLENINFQLITRTTISLQSIVELHLSIQFQISSGLSLSQYHKYTSLILIPDGKHVMHHRDRIGMITTQDKVKFMKVFRDEPAAVVLCRPREETMSWSESLIHSLWSRETHHK